MVGWILFGVIVDVIKVDVLIINNVVLVFSVVLFFVEFFCIIYFFFVLFVVLYGLCVCKCLIECLWYLIIENFIKIIYKRKIFFEKIIFLYFLNIFIGIYYYILFYLMKLLLYNFLVVYIFLIFIIICDLIGFEKFINVFGILILVWGIFFIYGFFIVGR